ncbi:4-hydroxy-tetrahydrodipicolinate synthase [Shouchella clausii]|uniref:4-hydroxy-tetrahydrodipicolinate synthase n=1 Tax=Shouchella clausii TaxID=79880 RepID=UPI001BB34086
MTRRCLSLNHVSGIYAALLTPFHEDQSIHKEALQQLVARMIDNGVHGLFALGTNGEFHTLTPQEKCEVATIVLTEAKGKVPVMLGVGGNYTGEVIQLAKQFEQLGATMFSVITPYFMPPNQSELANYFEDIANATKVPIFLYNIPSKTGVSIDPLTVARLAKHPNIYGIKDSSGDFQLIQSYIRHTQEDDFVVFAGTDSLILKTLQEGGGGAVAATANALPKLVSSIFTHFKNGQLEEAEKAQAQLQPLRDTFSLSTIPASLKKVVELSGIPVGPPRRPVQPVDSNALREIEAMIRTYRAEGVLDE